VVAGEAPCDAAPDGNYIVGDARRGANLPAAALL
jgi:hypothetical protein